MLKLRRAAVTLAAVAALAAAAGVPAASAATASVGWGAHPAVTAAAGHVTPKDTWT